MRTMRRNHEPLEIDFGSEAFQADPWPVYARLRRTAPVHWSPTNSSFVILRYSDVRSGLRSRDFRVDFPLRPSRQIFGRSITEVDGTVHGRWRAELTPFFSPSAVQAYTDTLLAPVVDEEIARATNQPDVDFGQLARRIPYLVVCRLLGLPDSDVDWLYARMRPIIRALEYPRAEITEALEARRELDSYLQDALRPRRAGDGSLLGHLKGLEGKDGMNVRGNALLLLAAGTETSIAAIMNIMLALLEADSTISTLREHPDWIGDAIRESLRFEPPVHSILRFVAADVVMGGVEIPRHSPVLFGLASANRDHERFDHAHEWDPHRATQASSLTFGAGSHGCLGANLAVREFEILFSRLLERFRVIRLASRDDMRGHAFRRPRSLHVYLA